MTHALRAAESSTTMVDEDDALDALDESKRGTIETPATGAEYALLGSRLPPPGRGARSTRRSPSSFGSRMRTRTRRAERPAVPPARGGGADARGGGWVGRDDDSAQSKRSAKSAKSASESSKSSKSSSKKRRAAEGAEEATTDTTSALIELLTRRAPPAPKADAVASGGFPSVVLGATGGVSEEETRLEGWQLTWSDEFDGDALDPAKWTPRANASAPGRSGSEASSSGTTRPSAESRAARSGLHGDAPGTTSSRARAERARGGVPVRVLLGGHRADVLADVRRVEIACGSRTTCPGCGRSTGCSPCRKAGGPRPCWPGAARSTSRRARRRAAPAVPGTVESGYHFAPKGECGVDGQATGTFPSEALGYPSGAKMDFHSAFHTFAVEWDKDALRYFVDGTLTNELTRFHVPIIPRWPFYLILNTAVSPFGLPEALECGRDLYHYVDYVRVYQRATKTVDDKVWASPRRFGLRGAGHRRVLRDAPRGRGRGFVTRVRARRSRRRRSQRRARDSLGGRRRPHEFQSIGRVEGTERRAVGGGRT